MPCTHPAALPDTVETVPVAAAPVAIAEPEPEVVEGASSLEHPIYLDSSCRMSMGLSLGDEVTYTDGKREYSFTVAGFFDQGLWPLGSKAVVSDEDYSYLEQHMDRYEIVGMNFAPGVDANEFFKSYEEYCKGTTLNDVSSEYMSYAYKDLIITTVDL